jgi:hypothetical protein
MLLQSILNIASQSTGEPCPTESFGMFGDLLASFASKHGPEHPLFGSL